MRIRNPFVTEKKALSEMVHNGYNSLWGAFANRTRRDYSAMLSDPTSSSLIMAVILWIVRRWPEAPVYLEDSKGDAVYDHPMLAKLNRPNPNYSGAVMWFGALMSFVWDGNGYIVKIRNKRDLAVRELWYVPHFLMEPMINEGSKGFIDYYQYTPGGGAIQKILPEDVIHLRYGVDPYNPRKGMSPLKSVARDAVTDEEADNFAASMLLNMGVPGLLITPDIAAGSVVNAPDPAVLKKYVKEQFGGDKRGEPMVWTAPTKVQQFGFDPRAMDLSTLRGIPEERVSAVTGIPAAVVGFGSGLAQTKVGATMKELREMAYEDGIIPIQRLIGPEIELQLLGDFEPDPDAWRVRFDLSGVRVLQDDQDALYRRTIDAFNGGLISRAQGKQALGFEALPTDDIRRVPFSVVEVPEGEALLPTMPEPVPSKSRRAPETKGMSNRGRAFISAQLKAHTRLSAVYAPILTDGFERIADRVVKAYLDLVELGAVKGRSAETKEDALAGDADPVSISIDAHKIMMEAAKLSGLSDELAWQAQYLNVTTVTAKNIEAVFGVALNLADPVMRGVLAKGGKHIALVNIDKQTQAGIFKALTEGRTAGQGPREIAREMRSEVEGRSMYPGLYDAAFEAAKARGWSDEKASAAGDRAARQYRAELIARTETKYAQNVSTLELAKGSGTFDKLQAVDAQLGPTDEICEERNGGIYSFEDAEAETEEEHPNGSLSWTPIISEE